MFLTCYPFSPPYIFGIPESFRRQRPVPRQWVVTNLHLGVAFSRYDQGCGGGDLCCSGNTNFIDLAEGYVNGWGRGSISYDRQGMI
jgi:hypothetical protein